MGVIVVALAVGAPDRCAENRSGTLDKKFESRRRVLPRSGTGHGCEKADARVLHGRLVQRVPGRDVRKWKVQTGLRGCVNVVWINIDDDKGHRRVVPGFRGAGAGGA